MLGTLATGRELDDLSHGKRFGLNPYEYYYHSASSHHLLHDSYDGKNEKEVEDKVTAITSNEEKSKVSVMGTSSLDVDEIEKEVKIQFESKWNNFVEYMFSREMSKSEAKDTTANTVTTKSKSNNDSNNKDKDIPFTRVSERGVPANKLITIPAFANKTPNTILLAPLQKQMKMPVNEETLRPEQVAHTNVSNHMANNIFDNNDQNNGGSYNNCMDSCDAVQSNNHHHKGNKEVVSKRGNIIFDDHVEHNNNNDNKNKNESSTEESGTAQHNTKREYIRSYNTKFESSDNLLNTSELKSELYSSGLRSTLLNTMNTDKSNNSTLLRQVSTLTLIPTPKSRSATLPGSALRGSNSEMESLTDNEKTSDMETSFSES